MNNLEKNKLDKIEVYNIENNNKSIQKKKRKQS